MPSSPAPTNVLFYEYSRRVGPRLGVVTFETFLFDTTPVGLSQFISGNDLPQPGTAPSEVEPSLLAGPIACSDLSFHYSQYGYDTSSTGGNDVSYAVDNSDPRKPRVLLVESWIPYVAPGDAPPST